MVEPRLAAEIADTLSTAPVRSVVSFTISFYGPALVAAAVVLIWRLARARSRQEYSGLLSEHKEHSLRVFLRCTSWLPIGSWAWLANRHYVFVNDTHASIYPEQILASMQDLLGAIVLLFAVLALDAMGQALVARRHSLAIAPPSISLSLLVVILLVMLDWIFLMYSWWMYFVALGR